jgi:hypothetical protein
MLARTYAFDAFMRFCPWFIRDPAPTGLFLA